MTAIEQTTDFPNTRSLMYCAEQIQIPPKFPNILKDYAKAVIRTQPYDLLRWSAAYFRCMATNIPPPVKQRLEPNRRFGTITRGYLKVLLEQVGKGYFVNRDVLQDRWESLSLPEDELLSFLSLCRMLDWPQIHWLKLFAVLVGTLNNSLLETLTMLCELLTEDVEGSPCPIPMWVAREIYTYLAALDCSTDQRFIGGCKVIGVDDELEPKSSMPDLPKIMNLETFRNAIMERFYMRLGIDGDCESNDFPYRLEEIDGSESVSDESLSTRPSHVSSSFKFIGDFANPAEVLRRTPDFDSCILLLNETQGFKLHEYHGAHDISEKTMRHVERREVERNDRIQHMHDLAYTSSVCVTREEHDKLLKDIEPPWSWIHQFATANCRDKSYNYLEMQSIATDETPAESSDESFDFEKNVFYEAPKQEESSVDGEEVAGIEDMLLLGSDKESSVISNRDIVDTDGLINDVITMVQEAVAQKQLDLQKNASIISLLEEQGIESGLDLRAVREAICEAEESNIVFIDLDDFHKYLKSKLLTEVLEEPIIISSTTLPISVEMNISSPDHSVVEVVDINSREKEQTPIPHEDTSEPSIKPIESKFEECMIDIDEKISNKNIPDPMILGIVPTPPPTPIIIPTPPRSITPPIPSPHNTSSGIISSNVSLHEFPEELSPLVLPPARPPPPPRPFECYVPALPGIGAAVSKETIRNVITFLKGRSRTEHGMVFPRHLRETNCPNLIDTYHDQ